MSNIQTILESRITDADDYAKRHYVRDGWLESYKRVINTEIEHYKNGYKCYVPPAFEQILFFKMED